MRPGDDAEGESAVPATRGPCLAGELIGECGAVLSCGIVRGGGDNGAVALALEPREAEAWFVPTFAGASCCEMVGTKDTLGA